MMQFAKKEDMPEVIAVWKESFGDTAEEITDFFTAFAGKARICIWKEKDVLAGQLVLLPVWLHTADGSRVSAEYIYAVATGAAFRKRGICTRLLRAVSDMLEAEGKVAVLVPADRELAAFYEKRDFRPCFREEKIRITVGERDETTAGRQACDVRAIGIGEYISLRKKAFVGIACVEQPEDMIAYAVRQAQAEGGLCGRITCGKEEYGILYREVEGPEGEIRIQEITAGETEEAVAMAKILLRALGRQKALLQRSFYTCGMFLPEDTPENGYFNLVLN
ncbi:MAG: GNAT family N-acetyltransferase [Lachnospiraceae bacterium]